jgi:hypothetical protein
LVFIYQLGQSFWLLLVRVVELRRISVNKLSILAEFWAFMRARKKWWLAPIILVMLMLSLLMVLTQGSALAPFIYTLF